MGRGVKGGERKTTGKEVNERGKGEEIRIKRAEPQGQQGRLVTSSERERL
jgi:hypothetical protein